MTEKDKIELLQTYTDSKNLAEALEKIHLSEHALRKARKEDTEFNAKFVEIANKHKFTPEGRVIDEEAYKIRKEKFLEAYAGGLTFMEAIKVAGFTTHSFQTQKERDKEFARRYASIVRGVGTNSLRLKKHYENYNGKTLVCVKCGRELPVVYFNYGQRKSCTDCCRFRRETMKMHVEEKKEMRIMRKRIEEADKECERLAMKLDTEGYIKARRQADILKQKYESLLVGAKNEYATVYHINVSNK